MSTRLPLPPPGFEDLSADEKVEYVQSLWDRIAANPETVPVPEWHKEVVRQRLQEHEADPDGVRDWDEVRARLRSEIRKRARGQ